MSLRVVGLYSMLAFGVVIFALNVEAKAQLGPPKGKSYGGSVPQAKKVSTGIAWYGVLSDGLKEAKRTGKPILLITAAPQCSGVPGMW